MKDWVNKKDKYGYTYEQIHRPGYAYPDLETYKEAYEPEEEKEEEKEEEELSEEALKLVKLREPGGYEDPLGGDMPEDIEIEDVFGAKELEKPKAPAPKAPVVQAANVMSLFSKAKGIKIPKRGGNREKLIEEKSHAYADVLEALRTFEGELPSSLKKLEKRFKTGKLKPYSKFLDQDRSWTIRRQRPTVGRGDVVTHGAPPSRPAPTPPAPIPPAAAPRRPVTEPTGFAEPSITDISPDQRGGVTREAFWKSDTPYRAESILKNAQYLRDGHNLTRSERPQIVLNGVKMDVFANHMEETPPERAGHGMKNPQWVLLNGKIVKHPKGKFNYGLDMAPSADEESVGRIKVLLPGTVQRMDNQKPFHPSRPIEYRTGWGRLLEVKTDKFINIDGQRFRMYMHYGHATPDSFYDLSIGQRVQPGQDVGGVGRTGKYSLTRYPQHLDVRGYVYVKDRQGNSRRVHISPSEWLPMSHPTIAPPRNLKEGGEVKRYENGGAVNEVPMDAWRVPRPRAEDVDQDIYERETTEVEFEGTDDLSEMNVEELGEWRDRNRHRLSNDRVNAVNELISIKIKQGKREADPPLPVYDRPTTGDETEYTKFATQERTTQPGEEPGEWGPVEAVKDPPRPENLAKYKPFPIEEITKPPQAPAAKAPPAVVITPEQQKLKQDIEAEKANQARLQEHQAAYDVEFKKYMSEQLQLTKLDPNRFWKSQGTVSKIFAILGSAAGAYSAGRWGGPNIFKKQIDDAINKDILSQKLDREDQIKRRSAAWKRVELMAGRLKNTVDTQQGKQKLDILEKTYKVKAQKANKKVLEDKQKELDLVILRGPMTREQADRLNLQYPKLKINERSIVGRGGKIWLARSYKEAQRLLKEVLPEATKALNAGERIRELVKEVGFLDQINPFSSRVAEAKTLREVIKGAIRLEIFGPGVMTDTERRIAEKIIANPNAIFTTDAKEVAKINTLMSKMRYGLGQRLRRAGLYLPKSQNEEAITQLLRVRKQRDTDRNRAQAVHDLVVMQEKYDKAGFTEKVAWIYNEPLPI